MKRPVASIHSGTDQTTKSTHTLLDQLFGHSSQRDFAVCLWNSETLPAGTSPVRFTLVLNHPGALRKMFRTPLELSLGESFIYGDFDIEGNIHAAVAWIDALGQMSFSKKDCWRLFRHLKTLPNSEEKHNHGRGPARLSGSRHSKACDQAAITYHYNNGNDFSILDTSSPLN